MLYTAHLDVIMHYRTYNQNKFNMYMTDVWLSRNRMKHCYYTVHKIHIKTKNKYNFTKVYKTFIVRSDD